MSYIQNTEQDLRVMLERIGAASFDELLEPIAEDLRVKGLLNLGESMSEPEVIAHLEELAARNNPAARTANFLGGGIYDHYIPATVRYVLSRSEFYTSYTPYQAEVSQGTLQAIYEYQSLICRLTGMDVTNASMYDAATALAESILMAHGLKKKEKVLIPRAILPSAKSVVESYAAGREIEVKEIPINDEGTMDLDVLKRELEDGVSAVVVSNPNYLGLIEPAGEISNLAHEGGALLIAFVNPISLALLEAPGSYDADIVIGEGQPLGNAMNFGGPLLGLMSTKKEFVRRLPGRLVSGTVDVDGERGYVMTLQTREQHIRREKATSNICSNEGLCALAAAVYLTSLGEEGFREVALQSMSKAHTLYKMLEERVGSKLGLPFGERFFHEFVIDVGSEPHDFLEQMRSNGVLAGIPIADDFPELGKGAVLVAVTERRSKAELELYAESALSILG